MKTHLQAIRIILCMLTLGVSMTAQAALNPPNNSMATITSGSFMMGNSVTNDIDITDAPKHQVTVDTFQMDKNLITLANWQLVYQWTRVNGTYAYGFTTNAGTAFSGVDQPVQSVSWYDAVKWCNARSQMENLEPCYYTDTGLTMVYTNGNANLTTDNVKWDATGYRLPTEAEWEKAARGGTTNRFPWGMTIGGSTAAKRQACYKSPMVLASTYDLGPANFTPTATQSVGSFDPNGFGLFDMAGNLNEWCWDFYAAYNITNSNNPRGPASGGSRVMRGGDWSSPAITCRCAARQKSNATIANPYIGFRSVRGKQSQTITFNPLPNHFYGDGSINLSLFAIGGGSTSPVIFTNTGPATISGNVLTITGTGLVTVTANQAGDATYSAAPPVSQSFTVSKGIPTITTAPTAGAITYGQTLVSSTLSGGVGSVPGSFAFTTPAIAPNAGTASQSVTFTPTDTTDYNTITTSVSVTVNKRIPTITTAPTASAISYGQTLASSALSGGAASVVGTFAFTTPSTMPGAGNNSQSVTFTPTDTANYNTTTTSVSVTVNKATPTITTTPTATAISYGQTLASSALSGGAATNSANNFHVGGNFTFTTPSTAPNAGTASQSVTFTPTDTTDYNTITTSVSVTVNKGIPTITTAPTASAITYGQTLASSTLSDGVGSVPGSFAFTTPATAPNVGTASQSVTFTPTDTTDYNTITTSVSVTVNKGTPMVIWMNPAAITYGVALGTNQLNATTSIPPGTFDYTPALGTVLNAGTNTLTTVFTPVPSQKGDYNGATNNVSLVVSNAVLTVTANDASRSFGVANPVFTASYSGFVNGETNIGPNSVLSGSPSLTTTATTSSNAGSYPITAAQGTLSATNYSFSFVNGTLTITNFNGIVDPAALRTFLGNGIVDQAGLNVVLANYWASSPPHISDFDISAKTNFTFIITNFNFTMQFSTNLVNPNWQDLGQAVFQFTDTNAVNNQTGFYRLVAPTNQ